MTSASDIIQYTDAIAAEFSPDRVVLFGSHAYGMPTDDSDVDLLVVMNCRVPAHRLAAAIRVQVPASFSLDLLVASKGNIYRRIKGNDFFLGEVMGKGIVLYDANDARVGAQGRRRLRRRLAARAVPQAQPI